jgi:hypothetical protein
MSKFEFLSVDVLFEMFAYLAPTEINKSFIQVIRLHNYFHLQGVPKDTY